MYDIYIWLIFIVINVAKYTIHGSYGYYVDGSEIRQTHQLRLVVYLFVYRVSKTFQVVV